MVKRRLVWAVLATTAVALALAACSPGDVEAHPVESRSATGTAEGEGESPLESILRLAEENDANDQQLAMLRDAAVAGAVPFEDLRTAVDATFACLDDAGIHYIEQARDPDDPYDSIPFSVEVTDSAMEAIADACAFANSYWIQSAYEQQPAGQEAADAEFDRARPLIIECLTEHGIPADESSTNDELKELLIYSETGIDRSSDAPPPEDWESMGCLDAAGLDGF
ncbi:hypothetical protein [Demequina sp.]|uniref:hypothetical protein n=1 Tax=Demequina sp. TaxID=2050685 RepID=UPI003D14AA82